MSLSLCFQWCYDDGLQFSPSVLLSLSLPLVPRMTPDGLSWRISMCTTSFFRNEVFHFQHCSSCSWMHRVSAITHCGLLLLQSQHILISLCLESEGWTPSPDSRCWYSKSLKNSFWNPHFNLCPWEHIAISCVLMMFQESCVCGLFLKYVCVRCSFSNKNRRRAVWDTCDTPR